MAKTSTIETQQRRLKLKAEELNLRVKAQENKDRLKNIKAMLKTTGGRIR